MGNLIKKEENQNGFEKKDADIDKVLKEPKPEESKNPEAEDEEKDEESYSKNGKQFVVFELENQQYAIDIIQIYEIERFKEIVISPIPKAPQYVKGIINLRGEVVPIIELRKILGMTYKDIDKNTRILIVKLENKVIGLIVDGVNGVIELAEKNISLPPDEVAEISAKYLTGIAKVENEIIFILNIGEILFIQDKNTGDKII